MYPKQRQKNENIPLLIKNLQENHDLLALILNELVKYKTTQVLQFFCFLLKKKKFNIFLNIV